MDGWKVAKPQDSALHGKWWEILGDPQLNALEEQVNISNQNVAAAFANFMAARALVREARAQYFPTVTAGASIARQHQPTSATGTSQRDNLQRILSTLRRFLDARFVGPRAQHRFAPTSPMRKPAPPTWRIPA